MNITENSPTADLRKYADVLAVWAESLPIRKVYIFGSRVRGDAVTNSDLDVAIVFDPPSTADETMLNWLRENETEFADLKKTLGVPLSLHADENDCAWPAIRAAAAKPVFVVGKVVCVLTPRLRQKS